MTDAPKIYVACLASYNAGILHGTWIDLDGREDVQDQIQEMLSNSPVVENAGEWQVHDHEYCCGLEYTGIQTLQDICEAYEQAEQDAIEWPLFCEFCQHSGYDLDTDALERFSEAYAGSADTLKGWCMDFMEETGQLDSMPENLRFYFDYDALARDMEISDVFTIRHNGETHVFWNH